MKKLLLSIAFLACLVTTQAQIETAQRIGSRTTAIRALGSLYVDSFLYLPRTLNVNLARLYQPGALFYQGSDSSLYTWTGSQFLKQAGGAGGATNLAIGAITANTIPITNSNGTSFTLPAADGTNAGLVTSALFSLWSNKLSAANLSPTHSPNSVTINNSGGTPATINAADGVLAGVVSQAKYIEWSAKLATVATSGSLQGNGGSQSISLKGDVANPAASTYYGKNAAGAYGYHPVPGGGGGTSAVVLTDYTSFQASTGLATDKLYFLTDVNKRGTFQYKGVVANQTTDNGGTIIVNAGLQQFERVYTGAVDMRWFPGFTEDVVTPGGAYAAPTGTDNKAVFDAAVTAAGLTASGAAQEVICEGCRFLINSNLAPFPGTKVVNIRINGSIFIGAGVDTLFHVKNAAGDYDHNRIFVENIVGRSGVPANGPSARTAGTSPNWNSLTATVLLVENSNKGQYWFSRVWGVKNVAELFGSGGAGSQENTVDGITWYDIANHVLFRSGDGNSFVDKNKVGTNAVLRLSGGLAIRFDGGPGNTGANRSDIVDALLEHLDSVIVSAADVTNPDLRLTLEAGSSTGIYSLIPFQISNTFRAPHWSGPGIFEAKWIGAANMGQGGQIDKEIWNLTYKVGDRHLVNADGSITTVKTNTGITITNMNALQASYPTWKFTIEDAELESTLTGAATVGDKVRWVTCTGGSYSVALGTVQGFRIINVKNNGSGTITITGAQGVTSIPAGQAITYRGYQNTATWQSITNLTGTGGGGGGVTGVIAPGTGADNVLEIVGTDIKSHAANATQPGHVAVGAQTFPTGAKTFSTSAISPIFTVQGSGFGAYSFTGRQNGMSWNDASTPNPSSTTLTAVNWGSGSSLKDIVFGVGKSSVNWVGFGNDGTDWFGVTEKTTGGFEFRRGVGYASMTLQAGSLSAKIFGTTGNFLVQSSGVATDNGWRTDIRGLGTNGGLRVEDNVQFQNLAGVSVRMVVADDLGNLATQTIPAGGGGGSTQWVAGAGTGSPIYYNLGPVNIGLNPAQSFAWSHIGASTSTRALWEIGTGTNAFVTVPRINTIDYNGTYLRLVNSTGIGDNLASFNNAGTFTQKFWAGFDFSPLYIDPLTSNTGDVLRSNGVDGGEWVDPAFEVTYQDHTAGVISTISATPTSLIGGAKTIPALKVDEYMLATGSGTIAAGTTGHFTFTVAGHAVTFIPNNTVVVAEKGFDYVVKFVPHAVGTNVAGFIYIRLKLENETETVIYSQALASGLNSSTGTFDVGFRFSSGTSPLMTSMDNSIEIKRKR